MNTDASKTKAKVEVKAKSTDTKTVGQKFPERHHVQNILNKTKIYGLVLLIIEVVGFLALGFMYLSFRHPYFMSTLKPDFLINFLFKIAALITVPIIVAGPLTLVLFVITSVAAFACLTISIGQFKKWKNLELSDQNYRPAILSIIFNALAAAPSIIIVVILVIDIVF